jgi:response regulator RpfG family c-di-GMP phosphodiesterase
MPENAKTVMICDDERDALATYAAILKTDYSIIMTSSGGQCIESFIQKKKNGEPVHVILLDFKLGDMTGEEVARRIKLLNGTKIILISAYDIENGHINELKKDSIIVEFIHKPVGFSILREVVKRVIQKAE